MTSRRSGWVSTRRSPSGPILPAPRCSWRSIREPSSDFESLRWIIARRSIPIRRVEVRDDAIHAGSRIDRVPCTPQVGRVEADRDSADGDPASADRIQEDADLVDIDPDPIPATGRVLEDDTLRTIRAVGHSVEAVAIPSAIRVMPASSPLALCEPYGR